MQDGTLTGQRVVRFRHGIRGLTKWRNQFAAVDAHRKNPIQTSTNRVNRTLWKMDFELITSARKAANNMAFGPAWYGALKCSIFFFGIPAILTVLGLAIWPPPVPGWAFVASPVAAMMIWLAVNLAWIQFSIPNLKQKLEFFANQTCPECGTAIGIDASETAQRNYAKSCDKSRKEHPTRRINFVRHWGMKCRICSADLHLNFEELSVTTAKAEQGY